MRSLRAVALVAMAAIVVGCTGSTPDGPSGALPSLADFPHPITGDRLLVLKDDGSIVTLGPDGSAVIALVGSRGIDVETRQPVWSPDGRSVAWAELELGDQGASSRLVTSAPDGSSRTEFAVETGTFFLQWDPTSSRIAYLGNFQGTVGMGVAGRSPDGNPVATTLGVGQPFYISWSPEGQQLLIHVGRKTLGTLDLEGNPLVPIGDAPGIFQAPVWLADGRMVYAATEKDRQTLVVRDGNRAKELVAYEGSIEFVASPDGTRIAYRIDDGSGLGGIDVVDLRSARSRTVTDTPTSAFHWSPDGRRLLLMTMEDGDDPTVHRWQVWDGKVATRIGPTFLPSPTFWRDYVPFYGQFAQTMTLWSPDGRSFAFAGLIGERAGVWVQDLDTDEPTFVLDGGSVVAWSPKPA